MNSIVEVLRDLVHDEVDLNTVDGEEETFLDSCLKFLEAKDFDGLISFVAGFVDSTSQNTDARIERIERLLGLDGEEAFKKEAKDRAGCPIGGERFAGEQDTKNDLPEPVPCTSPDTEEPSFDWWSYPGEGEAEACHDG